MAEEPFVSTCLLFSCVNKQCPMKTSDVVWQFSSSRPPPKNLVDSLAERPPHCAFCTHQMVYYPEPSLMTSEEDRAAWEEFARNTLNEGVKSRYVKAVEALAARHLTDMSVADADNFEPGSDSWRSFFRDLKQQYPEWFGGEA